MSKLDRKEKSFVLIDGKELNRRFVPMGKDLKDRVSSFHVIIFIKFPF
jgi:hypothetical protein